jgi:integrase
VRYVELLPMLRDELAARKASHGKVASDALVFGTASGAPHNPSNIRNRVLSKAVAEANEQRERKGLVPLPRLTPHSLRRTFASLLYGLGRTPVEVMEQLGHTDPKLALRLYARAMRRDAAQAVRLSALAGLNGVWSELQPEDNRPVEANSKLTWLAETRPSS